MKRLLILSVFALVSIFMTAGYSDSSDTKQAQTDQVEIQDQDNSFVNLYAQADFEHSDIFVLDSPELGSAATEFILTDENLSSEFISCNYRPPGKWCQKSELNI